MNYLIRFLLTLAALTLVACAAPQQVEQPEEVTQVEAPSASDDATEAAAEDDAAAESEVETGSTTEVSQVSEPAAAEPDTTAAEADSSSAAEVAPEPEPDPTPRPTVPVQLQGAEQLLEQKTFYFDFDNSALKDDSFDTLDAHAIAIGLAIAEDPSLIVTIEGHADERGTQEYNIALGMRRSEAVSRYLRVKGIPAANINTISFGEAKPVELGSDEASWAANRRAVLNY